MPSDDGDGAGPAPVHTLALGRLGYLLFDSLVHHLIEKGVITKNDALSMIQTAAEVVRGQIDDSQIATQDTASTLERIYSSFEAVRDRPGNSGLDGGNVRSLRPPLHGDRPRFPTDD